MSGPRAPSPGKPKFEKPSETDMRESLVRLDAVEVWAARAYGVEAMPFMASLVRRAVLGLFRDGRVVYMESRGMAWTRMVPRRWWGHVQDLGDPRPVPKGFQAAKVARVQRVSRRSFVAQIEGRPRIICFTGFSPHQGEVAKVLGAGVFVAEQLPTVGTIIQAVQIGATRAGGALHGSRAVRAADVWRSVLSGELAPSDLPLFGHDGAPAAEPPDPV